MFLNKINTMLEGGNGGTGKFIKEKFNLSKSVGVELIRSNFLKLAIKIDEVIYGVKQNCLL
ncbi:MAG: hypothetical protein HYX39_06565 [Bacteroidetes bacterium]|nr:hypothetical protein [Bacteroidota bacterium]